MQPKQYYVYRNLSWPEEKKAAIDAFLRGESPPGDLEKLKGYDDLFSLRLGGKERLLFTYYEGRPLFLEYLPNHEYGKSWVLNSKIWRSKLPEHASLVAPNEENFELAEIPAFAQDYDAEGKPHQVNFFKQKPVILSEKQEGAVFSTLPAVVNGPAGSGKTCVAMSVLERYAIENQDFPDVAKRVLYVCQSEPLAKEMRRVFVSQFGEEACNLIEIKSYKELIEVEYAPCLDSKDFSNWFHGTYLPHAKQLNSKTQSFHMVKDTDLVYQEFRVISGLRLDEDYLKLGQRQSLISAPKQRKMILEAYEAYKCWLDELQKEHNQVNPDFYRPEMARSYDVVLVDEGQDLSGLLSRILYELAKNGQIIFYTDTLQSITDNVTKRHIYNLLAHERGHDINFVSLPITFRCPGAVANLANAVIDYKRRLTGGALDKEEVNQIIADESKEHGHVEIHDIQLSGRVFDGEQWQKKLGDNSTYQHLRDTDSTDIAIIVPNESLRDEAMDKFNTPLVFTPEEVKGLEYDHVVLYRMCDGEYFNKASNHLKKNAGKGSSNRAKRGKSHPEFGRELNKIFVACTRAKKAVYMYEQRTRANAKFLDGLKASVHNPEAVSISISEIEAIKQCSPSQSSDEKWLKEAEKLVLNGNITQATIILTNLHYQPKKIAAFINSIKHSKDAGEGSSSVQPYSFKDIIKEVNNAKDLSVIDLRRLTSELLCRCLLHQNVMSLIEKNPSWLANLPAELWQPYQKKDKRLSALYCLFYGEQGMDFLYFLLESHRKTLGKIIKNLPKGAWHEPMYGLMYGYDEIRSSPLLKLVEAERGVRWLSDLNDHGIWGLENFDLADLLFEGIAPYGKVTPLFWLSRYTKSVGSNLFKRCLESNPKLLSDVPHEEWFLACVNFGIFIAEEYGMMGEFDTSPFYWLCHAVDVDHTLEHLFFEQPDSIVTSIPKDAWTQSPVDELDQQKTPLYWLCSNPSGCNLLAKLSKDYPKILRAIPKGVWSLDGGEKPELASPIDLLVDTDYGRKLLREIAENSPELFDTLFEPWDWKRSREEPTPYMRLEGYGDSPQVIHALVEGKTKNILGNLIRKKNLGEDVSKTLWDLARYSATYGYSRVIEAMVTIGAIKFNKSNKYGVELVLVAANFGQVAVLKELAKAENIDLNRGDKSGITPAITVAARGFISALGILFDHGADLNKSSNNGITPVLAAAVCGHKELLDIMSDIVGINFPHSYIISKERLDAFSNPANGTLEDRLKNFFDKGIGRENESDEVVEMSLEEIAQRMGHDGAAATLSFIARRERFTRDIIGDLEAIIANFSRLQAFGALPFIKGKSFEQQFAEQLLSRLIYNGKVDPCLLEHAVSPVSIREIITSIGNKNQQAASKELLPKALFEVIEKARAGVASNFVEDEGFSPRI